MRKKKGERPGKGAVCSVLTRFVKPPQNNPDKDHRSRVVLDERIEKTVKNKTQTVFTFRLNGVNCYANHRYCKVLLEGRKEDLFDPPEREEEDDNFKEPRIKWRKSAARAKLIELIIAGDIPDDPEDETPIENIYGLDPEFCLYDRSKFPKRLKDIQINIQQMFSRADDDLVAFENYKANHQPSLYSHKGYEQWQGSDAQMFLLMDLDAYERDDTMKPYDLWMSRPEYREHYPLHAFRSKIDQEIRTAKYHHTMRVKGLRYRSS